ncbi:MAG: bifunctional aconitate hydratase 2/2-methylisocitrate dehydratase [Bdellovibrionales bacterium]|jgi:aconitate hydratase 2 / 2-methylisocitrate dehydratase|nr:bifunctional aconitate hydratase 2/2-methylisocitrate dehydratase [Bdellovibrionales bacterium]MBT3525192.1 bifunctional aconitate hydratase 2/2-methylisocitrate dehydratase [Bdellovibrionales bacterium]MBT7668675.1 bifunctional aconitate hydratase 2/2-methylisocitrate dehydratase [Bdellovibrionales bacterium]MBT7766551.1 bifunctional aconitate hydratase 2/2-methylisocitrate dehydratase [Bdellovibrionales bacterium]
MSDFFKQYQQHVKQRSAQGIPPLALTAEQTKEVTLLARQGDSGRDDQLANLLIDRVNPGVDPAAAIKSDFLLELAQGKSKFAPISAERAIELLGTMVGGYNLDALIKIMSSSDRGHAGLAANQLKKLPLAISIFEQIESIATEGDKLAQEVLESWAKGEWFTSLPEVPLKMECIVYRVDGEINTDDFSPASQAFTRADIPLHSLSMGGALFTDGPSQIATLKESGLPVAFVGDVVGTGSSRKSACNSLLWHIGEEISYIPNKKRRGVILGNMIAPIFFNTAEDSGAMPIEADVSALKSGTKICVLPHEGKILGEDGGELTTFSVRPNTLLNEYRAGGRVPLIIGKQLVERARNYLGLGSLEESGIFVNPDNPKSKSGQGYTLAQKMVGVACGTKGVLPGTACLPKMTTVGSQDTTGPMTANEMTELACLKFNADLVMQSFCHTAAYPKPSDVETHRTLPKYIDQRGGVALRPGDGVIHSWLNRLLVPDTVGTGGDSHTRFPLGISFPAGSGLVAFAAALGVMPLDMPESVLVRFKGELRPGITLRDLVNMIPYQAIQEGLLTVEKEGKKNVFSGRILEMEGLPNLTVEQAFELTDAAAERSAAAATIKLGRPSVEEYLRSNVALMEAMIEDGYQDADTLRTRIAAVNQWLDSGQQLISADNNAEYAAVIEIDLNDIDQPILACPNDPDDVKKLSEVAGRSVDDVFIGSCMTNIGHFRAASTLLEGAGFSKTRLWICPPTKMDKNQLTVEGHYSIFAAAGARIEIPGCSLCMGNQARVADQATVYSTSTRNFNNRMGKGAQVFLGSSELAAVVALTGHLPSVAQYFELVQGKLAKNSAEIYRYLNFDQIKNYTLS